MEEVASHAIVVLADDEGRADGFVIFVELPESVALCDITLSAAPDRDRFKLITTQCEHQVV